MNVSTDSAKRLSVCVWAVSFVVLFSGSVLLKGVVGTNIAIFGAVLSTFAIAPAMAMFTYLRLGGDIDELGDAIGTTQTDTEVDGPVGDEQREITMDEPRDRDDDSAPDSLATLRDRYATGELTDEQFEHKVDQLLQTETPEKAAEWRERTRDPGKE
jgi:hypothetical protein